MPSGGIILLDPTRWFIQIYYLGLADYERDLQHALRHVLRPGSTFVDCGANAGFFSVLANDLMQGKGDVIAIEANPALLPQLNANLAANGITRSAVNIAVASKDGEVDLFVPTSVDVLAGMKPTALHHDGDTLCVRVPATTLDALMAKLAVVHVDAMKIDIEGGEIDALRSAEATIARDRPVLLVEYSRIHWKQYDSTPDDLISLCERWNYRICRFDPVRDLPISVEAWFWNSEYANMVLLPL